MNLPYLVTRKRLRDYSAAVRIAAVAGLARKLDAEAGKVPPCRHSRRGEKDSCASCVRRETWADAARLARAEAAGARNG